MKKISAADFIQKLTNKDLVIVDVRSPDEYAYEHIPGSFNIPIDTLAERKHEIPQSSAIYVVCQSGLRSENACNQLQLLGLPHVLTVEGGIKAIEKAGGKIQHNKNVIPIMRQVQIAAGTLVLLGIFLSWLIHPSFICISIFVGCGLIFAGASGFCGMALLLAKMPWNKTS
jgi:rhodanese-related sulfurtransferase